MKKLLLTIITVFTVIVAYAQQPVLQPSQILSYGGWPRINNFEYNENGTLANFYRHAIIPNNYEYEDDTVYMQYNDRNNLTTFDWCYYDDGYIADGRVHMVCTYNGKNRLVGVLKEDHTGYGYCPVDRWVAVYDETGRIVIDSLYSTKYTTDGDESVYLKQVRNITYTETQKVTLREQWDLNENVTRFRITEIFTSDGMPQSVIWEKYNYTTSAYENKKFSNCIYSDGRLVEVEEEVWDSDKNSWVHDRKTVYTRDANGRIAMTEYKLWNSKVFTHYKRTLYERNNDGYPTTIQFQNYSYEDKSWDEGRCMTYYEYYGEEYVNHPVPLLFRDDRLIDSVFNDNHLRFINNQFIGKSNITRLEITYTETPNPHYAVDEVVVKPFAIYPNPTKDRLNISFSGDNNCRSVEIYSIDGRLVETSPETSPSTSHPTTIDISNLTHGMYILKVKTTDGKEYTERIVKE